MKNVISIQRERLGKMPSQASRHVSHLIQQVETILGVSENMLPEEKLAYKGALSELGKFIDRTRLSDSLIKGDYQANLRKVAPVIFDAKGVLYEVPYISIIISLLARQKKASHLKRPVKLGDKEAQIDSLVDLFIADKGLSPNSVISLIAGKNSLDYAKKEPPPTEQPIDDIAKVA